MTGMLLDVLTPKSCLFDNVMIITKRATEINYMMFLVTVTIVMHVIFLKSLPMHLLTTVCVMECHVLDTATSSDQF